RLVYGRMTGWGQAGPLSETAGHDINYIALTGALHAIGPTARPMPPLNLLGDFGGGALYLAFGMVAALLHAEKTGQGQVVDAAITDGTAHLMAMISGMAAEGRWQDGRERNLLDGAAPFYRSYQCACGGFVAVGALEPQFWAELLALLGLDPADVPAREDEANWPELSAIIAARIAERSRDEWATLAEGTDACLAPVLTIAEAPDHPHNRARGTFVHHDGRTQPAPAPRLGLTPGAIQGGSQTEPMDIVDVLHRWDA
ncbi:MAG: CoA transferase, partial [Rhodobacteraceae bacterium]|nr:CoA transferase [Paracoccaceae bacterium]